MNGCLKKQGRRFVLKTLRLGDLARERGDLGGTREEGSARGKGGANAAHVPVPPRPGWQNCFSQFNKLNINASVLSSVPSAAFSNLRSCYVKWAILVAFGLKPHFKYRFHSSRNSMGGGRKGGGGESIPLYSSGLFRFR